MTTGNWRSQWWPRVKDALYPLVVIGGIVIAGAVAALLVVLLLGLIERKP